MALATLQTKPASPDFSLLLTQLENELIKGQASAKVRRILNQTEIWLKLDDGMALKWARLAQMAGEIETALRLLGHIHQTAPQNKDAWTEHLELLAILDRPQEMAKVLAAARKFVSADYLQRQISQLKRFKPVKPENELVKAEEPFVAMRRKQSGLERFLSLFCGREDCFARQWADKKQDRQGYAPVRRAMTMQDIEDHFKGVKTYGIYLLQKDAHVKTAVLDADLKKAWRHRRLNSSEKRLIKRESGYLIARVKELADPLGQKPLIEFSGGKGLHFWFFWEKAVPAGVVKTVLTRLCDLLKSDLSVFDLEVFPKQAQLNRKGLGNLVKLPLGVHRQTGKRSFFIECAERTTESQLAFLEGIRPAKTDRLMASADETAPAIVLPHPRLQQWAQTYPELFKLQSHCPPLGQVIEQCRSKTALALREEKIVFQTIGFLPRRKMLLHYLFAAMTDYNPHETDFKLSRLRGTPLGCRRIHALLNFTGDFCPFDKHGAYLHPLLHLDIPDDALPVKAEKVENLTGALDHLKMAISQVERFMQ